MGDRTPSTAKQNASTPRQRQRHEDMLIWRCTHENRTDMKTSPLHHHTTPVWLTLNTYPFHNTPWNTTVTLDPHHYGNANVQHILTVDTHLQGCTSTQHTTMNITCYTIEQHCRNALCAYHRNYPTKGQTSKRTDVKTVKDHRYNKDLWSNKRTHKVRNDNN